MASGKKPAAGGRRLVASHQPLASRNPLGCHLPFAILFGLSLFFATGALSQEPGAAAQPAEAKPGEACTVEGQVVKSTTGEGVRKIVVGMDLVGGGRQRRSATTDAGGHFVFRDVPPGRYVISAGGDVYPQQWYGQQGRRTGAKVLEFSPGQHVKGIVFRVQPPGVITGTVNDEDGDPVINAQVQALRIAGQGQRRQVTGGPGAQTNDRGEYRIFGLEPGKYFVVVNYQRPQTGPNEPEDDVYVPTFFPGTPDTSQATPVEVGASDEVGGIDMGLRLVHGVHLGGNVQCEGSALNPRGVIGRVYVSLLPRDAGLSGYQAGNYGASVQDKTGSFEIHGVPPGSYFLSANWRDGKKQYYGRLPIDVSNASLDGITLVLASGIDLHGRLRTDSDAKLEFRSLNLWLQPTDNSVGGGGAQVKPDGTFVIENLYDGNYRLHVGGFPEEYYIKSARLGGMDVLQTGLNVSHGQALGQLEITLTLDGGRVDGTVLRDQKPFGGALVVLVPDPPLRNHEELYSFKRSDSLGRFSMLGLPPGEFKLFAWEPVEGVNFNDPDYIKLYEDHGIPVHIEEKRQQNVQLELIPAEEQPRE